MSDQTKLSAPAKTTTAPLPVSLPQPPMATPDHGQAAPNSARPMESTALPGHNFGKIGVHYGEAPAIQPKLTVGPVNDVYEQEADRVAQQVVGQINAPTSQNQTAQRQEKPEEEEKVQTKPLITTLQRQEDPEKKEELQTKSLGDSLQRQENPEEEKEQIQTKPLAALIQREEMPEDKEELQTKPLANVAQREEMPDEEDKVQTKPLADSVQREDMPDNEALQTKPQIQRQSNGSMAATPAFEGAIHQARGSGQALADDTRQPMERAFGADFSRVKVHTDAQADQLNRSIQARAFTTGQDIFFRQGEHSPGTRAGQELLAHELTHVVQQNGNT